MADAAAFGDRDAMAPTKLSIAAGDLDAARSITGLLGEVFVPAPLAVTQFETGGGGYIIEAYFDAAPDAGEIECALAGLGIAAAIGEVRVAAVPDENWVALSQAALPPVAAGRFVVHGSHDAAAVGHGPNAILIDAGEAFGTAHHATTQGCLAALDRLARRQHFADVLDLGCGSGVLAIAALRLFPAAAITASDNDPVAVAVAAGNARRNGAGQHIAFATASGFAHPRLRGAARYDLILANILAGPLITLAAAMKRALRPGGHAILSGLLVVQAREVAAAYRAQGFRVERRADIAGWSTLTLVRS